MSALRYAVRAVALSLSLTALGAFCIAGGASPSQAAGSAPVGGSQLARPGVIVNLAPGVPAPPAMPGASFLVADLDTGQILAARAPHSRHLPASTLKALTALTLIPRLAAERRVVALPEDLRVDGTHVGILAGTAYPVRTLLQGLLIASGNDTAYALARANHGIAATLDEMNATAEELGAFDTVAKDPSGLDRPGQTTSAYDLALIGRAAMRLPAFRGYVATKQASVPGGRSNGKLLPGFRIGSHNTLLYNYDGAIGIKNGYTVAAKQTFMDAATRRGKTYIVTEMASPNGSWRPTAALLDWAFAHAPSLTPIGQLVEPHSTTRPALTAAAGGSAAGGSAAGSSAAGSSAAGSSAAGGSTTERSATRSLSPAARRPWLPVAALIGAGLVGGAWATRRSSVRRRRA
jgi:D-alanyl-D-alanine carboxypeptidase (penicillin-binding protein 5/6)